MDIRKAFYFQRRYRMGKLDNYKIDESCEFTPEILELARHCLDDRKTLYLDGKPISQVFPLEERYCKKVTGLDYGTLLSRMLAEINPDPWKAAQELFFRYGEEYDERFIPGMTQLAMSDYVDDIAAGKITIK
jgi:hypothetical protein